MLKKGLDHFQIIDVSSMQKYFTYFMEYAIVKQLNNPAVPLIFYYELRCKDEKEPFYEHAISKRNHKITIKERHSCF